ncbi:chaperone NapD [Parendozoicomonas sp. Alg238-R29]|uniref:chaperone NapD n=1 Tax=Parendozoicomonas sp. Alg238-R29 TaxID=2993446 RepID=UPI00248DE86F|nr:chaperone NapD [Parendozoicomonas sp. Alg238-R29]
MNATAEQPIDICGLVVLSKPEQTTDVRQQLNTIPGLLIHASDARGRMAVTIENQTESTIPVHHHMDSIRAIGGVVDVSLAYSHCE